MRTEITNNNFTVREKGLNYQGELVSKRDSVLGVRSWRATSTATSTTLCTVGTDVPTGTKLRLIGLAIYNGESAAVTYTIKDNATEKYVKIPVASGQAKTLGPDDGIQGIEISTSLVITASAFAAGSELYAACMPILPGTIE